MSTEEKGKQVVVNNNGGTRGGVGGQKEIRVEVRAQEEGRGEA